MIQSNLVLLSVNLATPNTLQAILEKAHERARSFF